LTENQIHALSEKKNWEIIKGMCGSWQVINFLICNKHANNELQVTLMIYVLTLKWIATILVIVSSKRWTLEIV